jgi:hypothetical protein
MTDNSAPITNNRFGNQLINNTDQLDPYYASGIPVSNNSQIFEVSNDTVTPYNGSFIENSNAHAYVDPRQNDHPYNMIGNTSQRRTSTFIPNRRCTTSRPSRPIHVPNVRACENRCLNRPDCVAWVFDKRNQQCTLMGRNPIKDEGLIDIKTPPQCQGVIDHNVISGVINNPRTNRASTTNHNVIPIRRPNETVQHPVGVSNVNVCRNMCLNNPKCNRWSFIPGSKSCTLYQGAPIVQQSNGSISGDIYRNIRRNT